jgi:hypothetical protein
MRGVRQHTLALFFGAIFLMALVGQAIAGHADYNQQQVEHARLLHQSAETVGFWRYLTTSDFAQAVTENWQSEYLQFTLYLMATVWLVQRGSPESKPVDQAGRGSDEDQQVGEFASPRSPRWARIGGWRRRIYENSLFLLMTALWLGSWFAQSVAGWSVYNEDQVMHKESTIGWLSYLGSSDFWQSTLQNWQSEFLAVGSFAVFAIYLRQRGSPESKPVGAAHDATGVEG